ncbi:putative RNA-directed DNA polymerase [Tanacetum coccineum]
MYFWEEEVVYVQAFTEAKLDEERFLKQKAKVEWLEVKDSNSAYFHKSVKSRNQKSRFEVIMDADNVEVTCSNVPDVFVMHYEMFLGSNMACDELNIEALGPDGFTFAFFTKSWDIVGQDVCNAIHDFFLNGQLLKEINHTFIAFIPKELMHKYHRNRGPPRCAFKVDIQKDYDTIDWRFLDTILKCFSFHPTMVKWTMACVSSTSFSLSLNGDIHGFFKGRRGLRQGDPLSPYLFTLVMEILTLIIRRRVRLSDSFRYHNHCEELEIINVCFADDLFIFARGEVESARVIMDSLDEFKMTSGLVPSIPKSTAYFCNVCNHVKLSILNIMPFGEGKLPFKYLGVPLISSRLLNKDCKILVEKAKNRIGDWENKSLSFAGRLQLFKSVISSMHVYWASVLVISKGIIYDIQQLIRGFLWCNGEFKQGKAKVAWDIIFLPKREGGLGIRSLELKGCTIWDVPLKANMSWGWLKLLQLRAFVRPFFWVKLDITREGFHLQNCMADLLSSGEWIWPQSWLLKAPDLGLVSIPSLEDARQDVSQCGGSMVSCGLVFSLYSLARFSFMARMRHSLKMQDKLRQWDGGMAFRSFSCRYGVGSAPYA